MLNVILTSVLVGIPLGLISVGIGHAWMVFTQKRDWRGWYMPDITEQEKKDWGF